MSILAIRNKDKRKQFKEDGGGGGVEQAYFREAVIDNFLVSVNRDGSALREPWTAKFLYTVHVHWRWIKEIKSLIWPNVLN